MIRAIWLRNVIAESEVELEPGAKKPFCFPEYVHKIDPGGFFKLRGIKPTIIWSDVRNNSIYKVEHAVRISLDVDGETLFDVSVDSFPTQRDGLFVFPVTITAKKELMLWGSIPDLHPRWAATVRLTIYGDSRREAKPT